MFENVSSVVSSSLQCYGLYSLPARLFRPWDFPGKNTGVGYHSLLQGIFLTQGSNLGLLHCRRILYHLSHQGSPHLGHSCREKNELLLKWGNCLLFKPVICENTSLNSRRFIVYSESKCHWASCIFFFFLLFIFIYVAAPGLSRSMWDLVPWPGIETGPLALGEQGLSHRTTREVLSILCFFCF